MIRVEMVPGALKKIRYLGTTRNLLEQHGRQVMRDANSTFKPGSATDPTPGYRMYSQPGEPKPSGRWRVSVAAVTEHAKRHNARHNILMRALQLRRFEVG